jgi:hypothetical protein
MPNWKKVIVSGSDAILNSVTASSGILSSGDIYAPNFVGTASYATISEQIVVTNNDSTDASFYIPFSVESGDWYIHPSSFRFNPYEDRFYIGHVEATSLTGSLYGTASFAIDAISSSYAIFADTIAIDNDVSDRIITANGNGTLNAEQNLSFNGTTLSLAGGIIQTTDLGRSFISSKEGDNYLLQAGDIQNARNRTLFEIRDESGSFYFHTQNNHPHYLNSSSLFISGAISSSGLFVDNYKYNVATFTGFVDALQVSASVIKTDTLKVSDITYPTADGELGDVITTDGAGTLSIDKPKIFTQIKSKWPSTMPKGTPVYASGSSGNLTLVKPASASNADTMPAIGVLAEDYDFDEEGVAIVTGFINGVNTSTFSESDVIYVGANGGFTNEKPTGSNLIQNLGIVNKSDVNGSGFVYGAGRANDVPNLAAGYVWVGNNDGVATAIPTASLVSDTAIINDTNNAVVTANGDGSLTAESNLSFGDGEFSALATFIQTTQAGRAIYSRRDDEGRNIISFGDLEDNGHRTKLEINDSSGSFYFHTRNNHPHYLNSSSLFISGAISASYLYINTPTNAENTINGRLRVTDGIVSNAQVSANTLTGNWLTSDGANRVITSDGDGTFTAESGLTFSAGDLEVSGDVTATNFIGTASLANTASGADRVFINNISTDSYANIVTIDPNTETSEYRLLQRNDQGLTYNASQNTLKVGHVSASALTVTESFNITGKQYSTASYHLIEVPAGQMYTKGVFFVTGSFPADQGGSPEWVKFPLLKFSTASSLNMDMIVHIIPDETEPVSSSVFRGNSAIAAISSYPLEFNLYTLPFSSGEYSFAPGSGFPIADEPTIPRYYFTQGFNSSDISDPYAQALSPGQTSFRPQISDEETLPAFESPQGPILLNYVTGSSGVNSSYVSVRLLLSSNTYDDIYLNYIQNASLKVTCNYELINYA